MPLSSKLSGVFWHGVHIAAFLSLVASVPSVGFGQAGKLKKPDQAAISKQVEVVKSTYEKELNAAATDETKAIKLVGVILSTVPATPTVEGKWALLQVAQQVAESDSGDIETAMTCVDFRGSLFDVDVVSERLAVLRGFSKPKVPATAQLFEVAGKAAYEAIDAGKYSEAKEAAEIATDVAKALVKAEKEANKEREKKKEKPTYVAESKFKDPAARLNKRVVEAKRLFEANESAIATLKTNPNDKAAQAAVGEYRCFLKADWAEGLPLLAAGSASVLAEMAQAEINGRKPADTGKLLDVADNWWDSATKGSLKESEVRADAIKRHAASLYAELLPSLKTPLDQKRARDRIADCGLVVRAVAVRLAPQLITAPFTPEQAVAAQKDWADRLAIPVTIENSLGLKLVLIPPGVFKMEDGGKTFQVTISKPFFIGQTEVTRAQWKAVMGNEPWKAGQAAPLEDGNVAAASMTWPDAAEFCKKLTQAEQTRNKVGRIGLYRLPTEAEWEYAGRAGTSSRWSFGDDDRAIRDHAWTAEDCNEKNERYIHPVAMKKPNAWGLYDVHGNVFEWCEDWFSGLAEGTDPRGPANGALKVNKGGSFSNPRALAAFTFRNRHAPNAGMDFKGFRIAASVSYTP